MTDRLGKMHGKSGTVPPISKATKQRYDRFPPKVRTNSILRDSLFYFVPGKMRQEFEGIWPRSARAEVPQPVEASEGGSDVSRDNRLANANATPDTRDGDGTQPPPEPKTSAWSRLAEFMGAPSVAHAWTGAADDADALHFFHTDHLGSTRIVTDKVGAIYQRTDYLPFGERFTDQSAGASHREQYTGQMWDSLTGLYFYNARYYDAEIGRFTQADTVVPEPTDSQCFNRYTYVNNNPYKYVDPSGHFIIGAIIGAIITAAIVTACVAVAAIAAVVALVSNDPMTKAIATGIAIG
ncbi:MAG: RHS repeat-associated core domain-containing protein, partial [bacterium]|nr:RHS repeat-associated core domain-containing protein [bacterium]